MTKEESRLFFQVPQGVELDDFYEEQLFEYKQFFASMSLLRKVFVSKLEKLKQMEQAYRLQKEVEPAVFELKENTASADFPDNVLSAFQLFEREKGQFKLKLMSALDGVSIYRAVMDYLEVTRTYRRKWILNEQTGLDYEGNVSKDPDPMEVLREIRLFNEQGGEVFSDVPKFGSKSFLLNEMKRVSLLNKNYGG